MLTGAGRRGGGEKRRGDRTGEGARKVSTMGAFLITNLMGST